MKATSEVRLDSQRINVDMLKPKSTIAQPGSMPAPAVKTVNVKVFIQKPSDEHRFTDAGTYAPGIPGVLVALFGLYGAHKLSQWRDRDKTINELCVSLKKIADEAAEVAGEAWSMQSGDERLAKIYAAKQKVQSVGIAATNLLIRSERHGRLRVYPGSWSERLAAKSLLVRRRISVTKEVSALRRACTGDPFEDPARPADRTRIVKITKGLGALVSSLDRQLSDYEA